MYLETFVTTKGMSLVSSGQMPGMLTNILECTGWPPQQRIIQTKILMVPRLRNLVERLGCIRASKRPPISLVICHIGYQ